MADFVLRLAAVAAVSAITAGPAMSAPPSQPLDLKVESTAEQVTIRVVGDSPVNCSVSYQLEVVGGTGNRSVNRGTAAIVARQPVTLATIRLGQPRGSQVSARLDVQGCEGAYSRSWPVG